MYKHQVDNALEDVRSIWMWWALGRCSRAWPGSSGWLASLSLTLADLWALPLQVCGCLWIIKLQQHVWIPLQTQLVDGMASVAKRSRPSYISAKLTASDKQKQRPGRNQVHAVLAT